LFDEPLSNLDPALRAQVRVEIRKLHDQLGVTSVYVTHDQVEAMTLADVLYVLEGGAVQQRGRPIDIYRAPTNCFVAKFLGSPAMNLSLVELGRASPDQPWRAGNLPIANPDVFAGLEQGRRVFAGVRPHDLALVDPANADLELDVEVVETLGPELTIHGKLRGTEQAYVAVVSSEQGLAHGVTRGDTLPLRVEHLHLFDADTKQTLRC
jgi:ABC-type sugar transport system ATPase subunit